MREIGEKMGYRVEKGKSNGVVGLGKLWRMMLLVEILEIAPKMLVVELNVAGGGGVTVLEVLGWSLRSFIGRICRWGFKILCSIHGIKLIWM
ncbi:hypothetical protein Dsin_002223 [Dipteronia sinensis]|uniref:Uncharacterized protein n=1 Tax=Dipteronia sinensis TaxID=43782 RepID=A0AAE0B5Q4_9ROSI|nr:hypothetical protein Dsin_002223 [Dipteronia sinensis]